MSVLCKVVWGPIASPVGIKLGIEHGYMASADRAPVCPLLRGVGLIGMAGAPIIAADGISKGLAPTRS